MSYTHSKNIIHFLYSHCLWQSSSLPEATTMFRPIKILSNSISLLFKILNITFLLFFVTWNWNPNKSEICIWL